MNSNLIYDIGMHVGEDSDFYLKKGFDVVGIEANPALVAMCEKRFAPEITSGQLRIVNRAVADTEGLIEFYIDDDHDLWGTADPEWKSRFEKLGHSCRTTEVRASPMKDILEEFGTPYYMKIDIEGHDHLCLSGMDESSDRPRHISIESSATSFETTLAQLEQLRRLGYTKFKMVLQNEISRQKCPAPAREGRYIDYQFQSSTSGLFGEELPGTWLDFCRVVEAYRRFYRKVAMIGPHNGIFRRVKSKFAQRVLGRLFYPGGGWYDTHASY